jgi:hypothetical protein
MFAKSLMGGIAATVLALGMVSGAQASTITDVVTFSISAIYPDNSDVHGSQTYNGSATVTGSFDLTYDPTVTYGPGYVTAVPAKLTDFTLNVTNAKLGSGNLASSFGAPYSWTYSGGVIQLASGNTPVTANPASIAAGSDQLVLRINTGAGGTTVESGVWYSYSGLTQVLTSSGSATVSAVPLPASLPLFVTGLLGLGAFGRRRMKRAKAV